MAAMDMASCLARTFLVLMVSRRGVPPLDETLDYGPAS
jgi:hypothetical protein